MSVFQTKTSVFYICISVFHTVCLAGQNPLRPILVCLFVHTPVSLLISVYLDPAYVCSFFACLLPVCKFLYVYLSVCPHVRLCLSSFPVSACLLGRSPSRFVCPFLSTYVCLQVFMSICLPVILSVCCVFGTKSFQYLLALLSVCLSTCPSVCHPISVCLLGRKYGECAHVSSSVPPARSRGQAGQQNHPQPAGARYPRKLPAAAGRLIYIYICS